MIREYDVRLVDLNDGPFETVSIAGNGDKALKFRIAGLLLDPGIFVISAAKLKTHDTVVVSLSVKNLAMGSIFCGDKKSVHQRIKETNRYIAGIAEPIWPGLAVIDGFEGMEGDGPTRGDPISPLVAIASVDALAADRVACEIMGVDMHHVGYLHYCSERGLGESDLDKIEVLGERVNYCIRPFRLHRW